MLRAQIRSLRGFFLAHGGSKLSQAWPRITLATLFATIVTLIEHGLQWKTYSLTATPFSIMGVAISFFLGFRNNTAYNRFWEARTLWGRLINASRSFARQTLTLITTPPPPESEHVPPEISPAEKERLRAFQEAMILLTIGYAHAMHHHLRDTNPFDDLRGDMTEEERAWLHTQKNVPLGMLQLLGRRVQRARQENWIDQASLHLLEGSLTELTAVQGGCERIKNTPMPETYTVLSHRIVSFFCYALPFGLIDSTRLLTPLVVFLVSYAFFGLDTLGEEISDPFGTDPHDLPLAAFAATIETNLRQLLSGRDLPELTDIIA